MRRLDASAVMAMALRVLGALALVAVFGPGCGLVLDFDPPDGQEIECFVTVVNPEGIEVDISSRTHPDFVEPSISFSGGGGFGGPPPGGTRPIRPYFTCPGGGCSAPCAFADTAAAEADFRSWINQRITEVASAPPSDSPFSVHAGPWCVKEEDGGPSTLRCESRENLTEVPTCAPALTADPLPSCPGRPPTGTCIEVECGGAVPCTDIDYGDLPVGTLTSVPVTLRNCGGPDDDFITVAVDGTIFPIMPLADFAIPPDSNGCLPRTPEEMRDGRPLQLVSVAPAESECTFEAFFAPMEPGKHEGETVFSSSAAPSYRIHLEGGATGGALVEGEPDIVCLDNTVGGCSERRTLRLTNSGPGAVRVDSVYFNAAAATDFRILRPPPPPLPTTLAAGASLDVEIQWCSGGAGETQGDLNVDSNADPPFEPIKVEYSTTPCPPGS